MDRDMIARVASSADTLMAALAFIGYDIRTAKDTMNELEQDINRLGKTLKIMRGYAKQDGDSKESEQATDRAIWKTAESIGIKKLSMETDLIKAKNAIEELEVDVSYIRRSLETLKNMCEQDSDSKEQAQTTEE